MAQFQGKIINQLFCLKVMFTMSMKNIRMFTFKKTQCIYRNVSGLVSMDYKKSTQPLLRPGWHQVAVHCTCDVYIAVISNAKLSPKTSEVDIKKHTY
jgi:hypothetical protein